MTTEIVFKKEYLHYMDNFPTFDVVKERGLKIGIISSSWHNTLIDPFIEQYIEQLIIYGVDRTNIFRHIVPGSLEILLATKELIKLGIYDAILCMGILIKGDTLHFENVLTVINNTLSQLFIDYDTPIINNILSCLTVEQALIRCEKGSELENSLALTTVYMGMKTYLVSV